MLVGFLQVHDESSAVKNLPGYGDRVQPVGWVEAMVGGHRRGDIRHVHRVVAVIVENLELVRVGVAIKLRE